jgi:hypothetical protein
MFFSISLASGWLEAESKDLAANLVCRLEANIRLFWGIFPEKNVGQPSQVLR